MNYKKVLTQIKYRDLIECFTDKHEGIAYYTPNDESKHIVAVHHADKIAVETDFYEHAAVKPFFFEGEQHQSDYAYTRVGDTIKCNFEVINETN